jgi:hypothetical protein
LRFLGEREGLRIVGWVKRVIGGAEWEVVVMVRRGWEQGQWLVDEVVQGVMARVVVRVGGGGGLVWRVRFEVEGEWLRLLYW